MPNFLRGKGTQGSLTGELGPEQCGVHQVDKGGKIMVVVKGQVGNRWHTQTGTLREV